MAEYIPIDQVVTINPGVIGTGSNPLALNGVFLGQNKLIPIGSLLTVYSPNEAAAWFGSDSIEAQLATVYFNGFLNAKKYPELLYYYAYTNTARGAWARGGSLRGMTLDELKVIRGYLNLSINGNLHHGEINLESATSFTNAAELIHTSMGCDSAATVTWDTMSSRFVIDVVDSPATSTITAPTGTAAGPLALDVAVLSQGSDVVDVDDAMDAVKQLSLNWGLFSVIEQLDQENMVDLAKWANAQKSRYGYVASDDDPRAQVSGDESNFGFIAQQAQYDGVAPIFDANDTQLLKAFVMGCAASIDWKQKNGRINFAFRTQSGLEPTCRSLPTAKALLANGYSYYGAYAASGPANNYAFFYDGRLPGPFKWLDTFVNQIYLNSQLQRSIIDMLLGVNSLPYNEEGYTLLRAAITDPVFEALNNGTIRTGIPLSESQKARITQQVGFDITRELYTDGWYFQIKDADTQTRGDRQSPPCNFFYCDGGSIQQVTLPSIVVL